MFKGSMKKVLAEKYGKQYAAEIMKKSKKVYRELVEKADDIGDDNPMAYNELFALAFVAPYVASDKKIPEYGKRKGREQKEQFLCGKAGCKRTDAPVL